MWRLILVAALTEPSVFAEKKISTLNFDDVEVTGKLHKPYDPKEGEISDEDAQRIPETIFDQFEKLILDIDPR